jgi:glycosyltransferase involved in cell wall biosynthesis
MKPKLIYLVTEDWYFHSHRLPMAWAALNAGFDVAVAANISRARKAIEDEGIRVIPLPLDRRSLNPFRALAHIRKIAAVYRAEKPALVHHIAMKPVLYGSIAAWMAGVPRVVNAFAGLGYVFNSNDTTARILRPLLTVLFRFLLRRRGSVVLVQNKDDLALLESRGLIDPARAVLIRGSGVDLQACAATPLPEPDPDVVCAFAGRMIGIKGLETLRQAFALLEQTHPHIKLWLCGGPDPANPGSWTEQALRRWEAGSDNVIYMGHCGNMPAVWRKAHIALQPSWGGEGVPKSLLEAAACGRPLIASDVPGCREVVEEGKNGFLVPPRDAQALAGKIAALAGDMALCRSMGAQSRRIVESDMSADAVRIQTEKLYRDMMR